MDISVVDPSNILQPCHNGHYLHEPIVNDRDGWEKRLVFTEHVFLSIWLLKFTSNEVTIWWALTEDRNNFMVFRPLRKVCPHASFPDFIVTSFPLMFLSRPWLASHTTSHYLFISIYHFHFMMQHSSALPTLWFVGSHNTQFMMDSSGCGNYVAHAFSLW